MCSFAVADVLLPRVGCFSYKVPDIYVTQLQPGIRVLVPLGKRGLRTGVVMCLHRTPPLQVYKLKAIDAVLDERPLLDAQQLQFITWISNYYLCTLSDALQAALPADLRPHSQVRLQRTPNYTLPATATPAAHTFWNSIPPQGFTYAQARRKIPQFATVLRELQVDGGIVLVDQLRKGYQPKVCTGLVLHPDYEGLDIEERCQLVKRAPQQQALLRAYSQQAAAQPSRPVEAKQLLLQVAAPSALRALRKRGILQAKEYPSHTLGLVAPDVPPVLLPALSKAQQRAYLQLQAQWQQHEVVLLQGVTGSGKTTLYLHAIQEVLAEGGSALLLLPEIALTAQFVQRLQQHFGAYLGIYHSRYTPSARLACWHAVATQKCRVVIGTRSAIFLPFKQLKLVIIDEAHEPAYKQQDTIPRYHGRDAAIYLAHLHGARALLGSATPSAESYYNAQQGKYGHVQLTQRFGSANLPHVQVVDLKAAHSVNQLQGGLTHTLLDALQATLQRNEQAIIFQNRRGYAPYLQCQACGHIPACLNCAVSLTYHQQANHLRCHYCGYTTDLHAACPSCGDSQLMDKRFGTEKIAEALQVHFPQASIGRLDRDTARSKHNTAQLLMRMQTGAVDILVGTQLLAKGLDFPCVTLVGVVDLDGLLNFPDFRSTERCFQLVSQVSGRAGRHEKPGKVLLQTWQPDHPMLPWLVEHRYDAMLQAELATRLQLGYPPHCRLIKITVRHPHAAQGMAWAEDIAQHLSTHYTLLGPIPALVPRIKRQYCTEIWLKAPSASRQLHACKQRILCACAQARRRDAQGHVVLDADPL